MNTPVISMALSARYQRLATEVFSRLPSDWHADRILRLEESRERLHFSQGRPAVACSARLQFKADQVWILTLYTSSLDTLSDEAMRWILARELGRVVSDSAAGNVKLNTISMPDERADAVAMKWGFGSERRRFEKEHLLLQAS